MPTQLLKQVINSKSFRNDYPYISFFDDQLIGTLTIQPEDRVELANLMFYKWRESNRFASTTPTSIQLGSTSFALESLGGDKEEPIYFYKEKLGYDFYPENNSLSNQAGISQIEEIKTVFTIGRCGEIAGFFDFDLSFCHGSGQAALTLNLNQIFVKPQFRGTTCWMDLTIAVCRFVSDILYYLANKLRKPHYFDVYVMADFYNKSDEKIAKFIESEIRSVFQVLPEIAPHRPALIGGVIADMGY